MYEFLDRLINIAIPRTRDFRGISPKSFDGRGNFSMGVQEQIIFPEIDYDKIDKMRGQIFRSPRRQKQMNRPVRCSEHLTSRFEKRAKRAH